MENEDSQPVIEAGILPPDFCPKNEQERLDGYVSVMRGAAAAGPEGKNGANGKSPIVEFSQESACILLEDGVTFQQITVPSSVTLTRIYLVPPAAPALPSISITGEIGDIVYFSDAIPGPDWELCWEGFILEVTNP